ncbi:MAG: glycosyltransferase family 4 protein [Bacteroidetes bacterium]|nr:glycosyltransferase family 4 protein [Bacteroidota bacterium]
MNILLSVQNMGLGGVTTYVMHLAAGLSQRHRVVIYDHNPYFFDEAFCKWLPEEVVIEKIRPDTPKDKLVWKANALLKKMGFSFSLWERLKNRHFLKVLKKYDIQLVTSFDKFSDKIVVGQVKDKLPVVLSLHGSYDISEFFNVTEEEIREYEKVFRTVKGIVYKADCNIRILDKYPGLTNIRVVQRIFHGFVYNQVSRDPVLLRNSLGISSDAFVFGMIGRGVREKGWEEALEAFMLLRQTTKRDIHFVVLGASTYLSELQKKYDSVENIHFTGFVENNIEWVNIFDVGMLPSFAMTENFTFSVVEYLFCGKPSIVTDHGEIALTIDYLGEKAGILTVLENGRPVIGQLHKAMTTYLDDKELYLKHRELALKAFGKFDSQRAVNEYEKVFEKVLEKLTPL